MTKKKKLRIKGKIRCPECGNDEQIVKHGKYDRDPLLDRFRCDNPDCETSTFIVGKDGYRKERVRSPKSHKELNRRQWGLIQEVLAYDLPSRLKLHKQMNLKVFGAIEEELGWPSGGIMKKIFRSLIESYPDELSKSELQLLLNPRVWHNLFHHHGRFFSAMERPMREKIFGILIKDIGRSTWQTFKFSLMQEIKDLGYETKMTRQLMQRSREVFWRGGLSFDHFALGARHKLRLRLRRTNN